MRKISLNESTFGEEEIGQAVKVLRSGHVTMGKYCAAFEEDFADYLGVSNAIMTNSGSSANLLAFFALANPLLPVVPGKRRISSGDEVIVPAVTWSTTVWPIIQVGGIPVFVDSDPATLQMDVQAVEAAIGEKTVAICSVHILGNAVEIERLRELADRHGLWLIEDACESLGTRRKGKPVGTFGDLGTFSFFFSHHITTIEGGMVVTDDDDIADLLRCLRAHGWTRHMRRGPEIAAKHPDIDPRFLFVNLGFNLSPTEINGVFGIEQLKKLDGFNLRRIEAAEKWVRAFADISARGRMAPMRITADTEAAWFGFPVICDSKATRDRLRDHLERYGIETRPIICGNITRQPALKFLPHRVHSRLAGADRIMDCGLYWGIHPKMDDLDVRYVSDTVREFFTQ